MKNSSNSEELPINIRFQYKNADDEEVLSDKFTVNLSIIDNKFEDFEEADLPRFLYSFVAHLQFLSEVELFLPHDRLHYHSVSMQV